MDFSEIAEDDFSSLGFEFDDVPGKPTPSKPRGGGGRPPRMPRGMPPHRPFGMRGNRGPPPRFMGPGPPRPPFPPMRSPMRGQMRPPFPPRGMPHPPMERGRPPFRNRPRRPPPMEKPKKEIRVEKPNKISETTKKPEVAEPTKGKKEGSIESEVDEDTLLRESGDETQPTPQTPEPRLSVDLDDAVSIHGDEEFEIEKAQEEKKEEEKPPAKNVTTPIKDKPAEPEASPKKLEKPKRKDDRPQRNRDSNRGRGRGNRDFHRGRDQPMFRGPDRPRFQEHRPFPAGPIPPNFPPPMHPPKNIHVNPRFMAPRPRIDGPPRPPIPIPLPPPHSVPQQPMPTRPLPEMKMPPMHHQPRRFLEAPPNYPPASMPQAHEMPPRFVPPPQAPMVPQMRRTLPPNQSLPMPEPLNLQIRNQAPIMHPTVQFNHALSPAIPPADVHRPVQPATHATLNSSLARASYEVNRMLLGNRVVGNERADLTALYNPQAYMTRQQQYPTTIQQMYDMNWQQQLRREPTFEREQAELPAKHTRERTTRTYSDNSDLSSRSRSGSFSDSRSRSYSRSPSRSWSRSRSMSPSPARSWTKSLSRSRSRSPIVRSRASPKREVRLTRNESPVRRVERSTKKPREPRRDVKKERGRYHEKPVTRNDNERVRDKTSRARRGSRGDHERVREKERGRVEGARGERGKLGSRERLRERGRNVESESRNRDRGPGTRRSKMDNRGEKESHGTNRHSRRGSVDRKPGGSANSENKANRVVATKSGSSGKLSSRIVIGSLPDSITPSKLKELLATIGPIEQLKMSTTKHKALVTFVKNEHALACRRKFHRAKVDDSQITVDFL